MRAPVVFSLLLVEFATCFTTTTTSSLAQLVGRRGCKSSHLNRRIGSPSFSSSNEEDGGAGEGGEMGSEDVLEATSAAPSEFEQAPLDPLIKSLTRVDDTSTSTVDLPLFGKIPRDGSLLLLVPAVLIAVTGFFQFLFLTFSVRDEIVEVLSKPPVIPTPSVDEGTCRGICAASDEDLEGLRRTMDALGDIAKRKAQ